MTDLLDAARSGMTTTGIPPFFHTSRRALWLLIELTVPFDTRLSGRPGKARTGGLDCLPASCCTVETDVMLIVEKLAIDSRNPTCFLTWRKVFCLRNGESTEKTSTAVEAPDLDDMADDLCVSMLAEVSEPLGILAAFDRPLSPVGEDRARVRSWSGRDRGAFVAVAGVTTESSTTPRCRSALTRGRRRRTVTFLLRLASHSCSTSPCGDAQSPSKDEKSCRIWGVELPLSKPSPTPAEALLDCDNGSRLATPCGVL